MITADREYRSFERRFDEENMTVEGTAVVFNKETVLWEYGGIQYKEKISDGAFADVDLSDVVLNIDHAGKPIARTKNKTLAIIVNKTGVDISATLKGTEAGRQAFEEVKGGYLDRMSFAFTAKEWAYDEESHTRTILKVDRLYDVSIVTFAAYEQTSISARGFFTTEVEKKHLAEAERIALERKKLILLNEIKSVR